MTGNKLIPLNELKVTHPYVYAEHIKKYKGRERLLLKKIPLLDCLWNDVLHISPINPQILIDYWRLQGMFEYSRIRDKIEVYKIPVGVITEQTTVCYQSYNFDFHNFDPNIDKFWQFNSTEFQEQKEVSAQQAEIWKSDREAGRPLLWYSHTMHVLAKQTIDTSECELIVCK